MTTTPKLLAPYIAENQFAKYLTHNGALDIYDALVQLTIKDRDLSAPPGSPALGDTYIVKAPGTGAWATHDNAIAIYISYYWHFYIPAEGWLGYLQDENIFVYWDGAAWTVLPGTVSNFTDLGDVPNSYAGQGGLAVVVNVGETGLEFGVGSSVGDFTDLGDVPPNYVGQANKFVSVTGAEDGLEFTAGTIAAFTDLTDTQPSYVGAGTKVVAVKSTEDGLEFITQAGGALAIDRGTLLGLAGDVTTATDIGDAITWDVATYDTESSWSAGDPTKLTVPAGVTKAYFVGQISYEALPFGTRRAQLFRNGIAVDGCPAAEMDAGSLSPLGGATTLNICSAPLEVVEGDYFTLEYFQDSTADVVIAGGIASTWFAMVIVSSVALTDFLVTDGHVGEVPTVNTAEDALEFAGRMYAAPSKALTDASTSLFEVALPAGAMTGGKLFATIQASDGTNHQVLCQEVTWAAVNKAGAYTTQLLVVPSMETDAISSGTLTAAWSITSGASKVTIAVIPAGSLTETTYRIHYTLFNNSPQAITIL